MRHTNSKTHRSVRNLIALLVVGFVLTAASSAFGLDRYGSRKGVFAGVGLGGGIGAVDVSNDGDTSGLEDRQLGFHLNGTVGGGVTDNIVLGAQANWWIRNVETDSQQLQHQHMSFLANANLFLIEGLYVDGGAGFAYTMFDAIRGNSTTEYSEMGLALKAGVGYEFFLNGTQAAGVNASYTTHIYSNASFDTVNGGLTFRWY